MGSVSTAVSVQDSTLKVTNGQGFLMSLFLKSTATEQDLHNYVFIELRLIARRKRFSQCHVSSAS